MVTWSHTAENWAGLQLTDGRGRRCHQDQVRLRTVNVPSPETPVEEEVAPEISPEIATPTVPEVTTPTAPTTAPATEAAPTTTTEATAIAAESVPPVVVDPGATATAPQPSRKTYPTRTRVPVDRYEPTW